MHTKGQGIHAGSAHEWLHHANHAPGPWTSPTGKLISGVSEHNTKQALNSPLSSFLPILAPAEMHDLDVSLRQRNIVVKRGWLRDFMVELARAKKLPPFTLKDALVDANGSDDVVVK